MDTTSPQNSTPASRAESFYLDYDPMAIFLVEDQLFRVHRHYFIQGSEIFRDMFSQARNCEDATMAVQAEGMSDEKPIVLSQVTVKEFRTLLRFFYAMTLPIPNKKALADVLGFDQDEKLALLSIAHQFVFDKIFEYVCGELEPGDIPVVDRVQLGDKYHLDKWLSSAYKAILERTPGEKLSQEEVDVLGVERVIKILEAKSSILHEVYKVRIGPPSPDVGDVCSRHRCHAWSCEICGIRGPPSSPTAAMNSAITQAVNELVL